MTPERKKPISPLEAFVCDYVEEIGGAWDEVEPQVYDLLLASGDGTELPIVGDREMLRVAFDPEALPEHPGAQLASYGTPLVDRFLAGAVCRGRYAHFYFMGLNLAAHGLPERLRRALNLTGGVQLGLEKTRLLDFLQVVYWFQVNFVSDQKEQEILPVALDLHFGRRVRHLEELLDMSRLAEQSSPALPEARRTSLAASLPLARKEILGTLSALANARARELRERLDRQIARMTRYYRDLRSELESSPVRAKDDDEGRAKKIDRRQSIDREEQLRIAELRQKNSLRVHLGVLQLLVIHQPKLLLSCRWTVPRRAAGSIELVWDPLLESLEAPPCCGCGRPTFILEWTRAGGLLCPACPAKAGKRGV